MILDIKEGQRVRIKSLNQKGKVTYIDRSCIYRHELSPIQIQLDKPYDDSGQITYRTSLTDIVKLKKKKVLSDDELFTF